MKKKKTVKRAQFIHPVDRAFGARIKEVREAKSDPRLTQTWMARALGVTNTQVQKYESGVNRVTVSRMFEIADALEMSVFDLLKPLVKPPNS